MFKKIMQYGTIAFTLCSLINLTSCGSSNTEFVDTEYFKGKIHKKEGYVSIIGLTDLGMEQEVLNVPMYINKLPVTTIGGNKKLWGEGETIRSEQLKKLYIPYTVDTIIHELRIAFVSEIVVIKINTPIGYTNPLILSDIIRLNGAQKSPNVTYFYNHEEASNDGYYWFDYITGANLYLLPPSPIRSNYEFVDWYLEEELITPWDKTMPNSIEESLNLYAKWEEK